MPETFKQAVIRRRREGQSFSKIGEALGLTKDQVAGVIFRARLAGKL